MSNKNVLVSISCITYNHAPYIRDCVEGFLMQKCDFEYEILIHDDASTDSTADIIREYEKKYPHLIKPIYQKENQYSKNEGSISARFNWNRAQGKYIALCEGDDYWTDPLKLQKQVDIMETDNELMAVATNSSIVDMNKNLLERNRVVIPPDNRAGKYNLHQFFTQAHQYPTLSVMFRNTHKEFIQKGMKKLANPFLGDWTLWVLLHIKGDFYYIDEVTCAYRINPNSVTHTVNAVNRWKEDFKIRHNLIEMLDKEYHHYLQDDTYAYHKIGMAYRKQKKFCLFVFYQVRAFLHNPKTFVSIAKTVFKLNN